MIINKTYKIEIKPNNKQVTVLEKSIGCSRFAYNWGLDYCIKLYAKSKEMGVKLKFPTTIDLQNKLNRIKKEQFPWMYNVSKCVPQTALQNLERAYINFFIRNKQGDTTGFPKFKSKHGSKQSFRFDNVGLKIKVSKIKIPKVGYVKLKETGYIPTTDNEDVKFLNVTVSKENYRWFVSVAVEKTINTTKIETEGVLGIDRGLKNCSCVLMEQNLKIQKHIRNMRVNYLTRKGIFRVS